MSHFIKSLKPQAVDEFRNISKMFRSGASNARAYYEHCEIVLGERFESIFPELLVLLPDISKQQVGPDFNCHVYCHTIFFTFLYF